jgi:glycosyltransferase involved in cell wall biosynthesis
LDFLFLHNNYPAQFKYLSTSLAGSPSNRVVFLTNRKDPETIPLAGVAVKRFDLHREISKESHYYLDNIEKGVLSGQAVLRECLLLKQNGFNPRFIIFHAGTGLSLYLKNVFPQSKLIGYFEWYLREAYSKFLIGSDDINLHCRAEMTNLLVLKDLEECTAGVTPTNWQKQQFPAAYQDKLHTIFDGIDTNFFSPADQPGDLNLLDVDKGNEINISQSDLMISYATRGMEPLRGFPEFMRMLPTLLELLPSLKVVIAGEDRCAYSYPSQTENGSWKKTLLKEIGFSSGLDRVHFVGGLPYGQYRELLRRSNLHCYFSRPYVPSWSLFEAVACGSRLMVNHGPHTSGLLPKECATWVDLDQGEEMVAAAKAILSENHAKEKAAITGNLLPDHYKLSDSILSWQSLLQSLLD